MKKSVKIVAALCLMAALVLTLAACGKKDPVGIWECTNFQEVSVKIYRESGMANGISEENIDKQIANDSPFSMTVILEADHTATMLFSAGSTEETQTCEWMETENGIAIIYDHANIMYYDWDGSKLVCTNNGFEYIFKKR